MKQASVISSIVLLTWSTCFSLLKADDADADSVRTGGLQLELVQVIFRHGDRNPVQPYPTDPYKDESVWPEGWGQLTKIGKMQQYKLGKYFRRRYADFLSKDYSPYEILVQSSNLDRTIMSADSNLAALYPPNSPRSLWNPELRWQPIPVHSLAISIDTLINQKAPCPRYEQLEKDFVQHSAEVRKVNEDNQLLYEILTKFTGEKVTSPKEVDYIHDVFFIEQLYNKTLPEWTREIFPQYAQNLTDVAAFSFKMISYTPEMQKLKGGPLLKEIIQNLENKTSSSGDPRRKMFMYSGHDTTIANFLNTLDLFELHCPPYASSIMIELYLNKSTNEYLIEILYRNATTEPQRLLVPGCASTLCPLGEFIEITKSKIPKNWEEECKASRQLFDVIGLIVAGMVSLLVLGLLVCLGMLLMSYLRNRRRGGPKPPVYPYLHLQMDDGDEGG